MTPKKQSKLHAIISGDTPAKGKIRDYAKVNSIFLFYLKEEYDTMSKEIYFYKDVEFFIDFGRYLNMHFKSNTYRSFFFQDVSAQYFVRLPDIWEYVKLKRERKKYSNYL
jgi:hypothetical protein